MGEAGGLPEDVLEVAEMQTIISLVAGGFGVSLVPASVGQVDRSGVAFRPFAGPTPTIELAIAWRSGRARRCATSSSRSRPTGERPRVGVPSASVDAAARARARPAAGGRGPPWTRPCS